MTMNDDVPESIIATVNPDDQEALNRTIFMIAQRLEAQTGHPWTCEEDLMTIAALIWSCANDDEIKTHWGDAVDLAKEN